MRLALYAISPVPNPRVLIPFSELCFTNAALFAAQPLRFLSLDQINFRLPVPIGAVLRLTSKIVHTTLPHEGADGDAKVHIMVRAEVEEVETGVRLIWSSTRGYANSADPQRDQYVLLHLGKRRRQAAGPNSRARDVFRGHALPRGQAAVADRRRDEKTVSRRVRVDLGYAISPRSTMKCHGIRSHWRLAGRRPGLDLVLTAVNYGIPVERFQTSSTCQDTCGQVTSLLSAQRSRTHAPSDLPKDRDDLSSSSSHPAAELRKGVSDRHCLNHKVN